MSIAISSCKVKGCSGRGLYNKERGKEYFSKGYCNTHYQRLYRQGSLIPRFRLGENRKNDPLYRTYRDMKARCFNKNTRNYKYYGGRGITVCDRWLGIDGFSNFKKDVGNRPTPNHSLDRINVDGNYEPLNVRWATVRQQMVNKRVAYNNTSGYKGVHYAARNDKWVARVWTYGKTIHIGCFSTLSEAVAARKKAEQVYY